MSNTVILGTARTPVGKLGGGLSSLPATELGGIAIKAAYTAEDTAGLDFLDGYPGIAGFGAKTAAAISGTCGRRAPAAATQGARSSAMRGTPSASQAATAFVLICAAKGWVASITWLIPSACR